MPISRRAAEKKEASIKRKKPFVADADFRPPVNVPGATTNWGVLDPNKAAAKAKPLNGEVTVTRLDLTEEQMAAAREKQEKFRHDMKQGRGHVGKRNSVRARKF